MELAYLFNIKSDAKVIIHDLYISHNHSNRRLIDEIDMGVNDPALIPLKHIHLTFILFCNIKVAL